MPEPRRAALYARFSSDLQNARSVDDQLDLCADFARRQGYRVAGEYSDRARSGATTHGRDGLRRLLSDAREGRFDVLIVEALDRLSRDQEDTAAIFKRLSFAGVEIVAVHDGRVDQIQVGVRSLVASLFLTDLKHKTRRGLKAVVKSGRYAGGRAYGYAPVLGRPGELSIVADEADVVRRIFREYVDGASPRDIAAGLNADGIPGPRGPTWSASTINGNAARANGILLCRLYVGEIVWNKTHEVRDPDTGSRLTRPNPPAEWVVQTAPHLAIVDRDLFDAAQRRKTAPHALRGRSVNRRRRHLLGGLVRCGHCGGALTVQDVRGAAVRVRCSTRKEAGRCGNRRTYRLDKITDAVIAGLRARLDNPDALAGFVRAYQEDRSKDDRSRARIERQVATLRARIDRLSHLLLEERIDEAFFDANIGPLRADLAVAEDKLAAAPAPQVVTLLPAAVDAYRDALRHLAAIMRDLDPREDRELIAAFRGLIDRVDVIDLPDGKVECRVTGHLAPLIGAPDHWGVSLAGAGRRQRFPPVFIGAFAA